MEWTSPEGISDCVVSLKVDRLAWMRLVAFVRQFLAYTCNFIPNGPDPHC